MTETAAAPTPEPAPITEKTVLDARWVRKMVIMIVAAAAFCLWGLYDANVKYPKNGAQVADYNLRELIQVAEQKGRTSDISTPQPTKELERLTVGTQNSDFDQAKFQWLDSLRLIGRLKPEYTTIENITEWKNTFDSIAAQNPGQTKPAPLSGYDIPAQWAIFGVCAIATVWMLVVFMKVKGTTYTWNAAEKRLGLPGGASFTPADIAEFDKRKWHKFFITVRIKPGHETLGGKSVTLDLYRYAKLEGWVLEMEEASGLAPAEVAPAA